VVIDTSALLAVIFRESSAGSIIEAIDGAREKAAGSPTIFEAEMVVSARRGPRGMEALRRLVQELEIGEIPFEPAHRRAATEAFVTYGKGQHPARLNLGDCLAFATAKVAARPLLCIGGDFARTDIELVPLG
jgi:ribonuclease VapC